MLKKRLAAALLALTLLAGCGSAASYSQDFFAMNTFMSITVYGADEPALQETEQALEQRVNALDAALTRTQEGCDVARLNHAGGEPVEVGADTYEAISQAYGFAELTGGAFDPTTAPLVDLWGVGTENARIPAQAEIDEALTHVGYENIELLGENRVRLQNGVQIDLGGIGKGFATDAVRDALASHGDVSVLAALGGNLGVFGPNPSSKDGLWKLGIADPDNAAEYLLTATVRDCSVVTSGDYERYFERDGKRYHHIFDPATGYPAQTGLRSVTVLDEDSTRADALTTALFVMGLDRGMAFCEEHGVAAAFITADKRVLASSAAQETAGLEFTGEEKGYAYAR